MQAKLTDHTFSSYVPFVGDDWKPSSQFVLSMRMQLNTHPPFIIVR